MFYTWKSWHSYGNVGSVVECSPATRAARVRFPDVAITFSMVDQARQIIFFAPKFYTLNYVLYIFFVTLETVFVYVFAGQVILNKTLAERSFDLRTSGLWAQHASTAPLCFATKYQKQRKTVLPTCHNVKYLFIYKFRDFSGTKKIKI